MRLLLDTADLSEIRYFNTYFPIEGVTTNPTILAKEGGDVLALLKEIRSIIGEEKELHVQVTATKYEEILEEAELLIAFLGKNTYIKVPATDVGLRATAEMSRRGIKVTMTAVLSAAQAMLAWEALLEAMYTPSTDLSARTSSSDEYHLSPSASAAALRAGFMSIAPTSFAVLRGLKRPLSHAYPSLATRFSAMPPNPITTYLTMAISISPCSSGNAKVPLFL